MEIYTTEQIRRWDQYTIDHEPVSSIDLMERAATRCVEWITRHHLQKKPFRIFCGKGNNGGDGLAMGRLLTQRGVPVEIHILELGQKGSPDFQANLLRLHELPLTIHYLKSEDQFPNISEEAVVVDVLFGSGLNKPLEGLSAALVQHLNGSRAPIISIDIPSGLFTDQSSAGNPVVKATHTLSFQVPKLAFMLPENAPFVGTLHLLDIGLDPRFEQQETPFAHLVDKELVRCIYTPRNPFAHKGAYGHALLIGGSYGKIGAVLLASRACLRTGAGLTTAYIPGCGYNILQTVAPEAMVMSDENASFITSIPTSLEKYTVIGVGPGLSTEEKTQKAISQLINAYTHPLVIDADGLNCLAKNPGLLSQLPPHSILTPHPKEFERLFGPSTNDLERLELARRKAKELQVIVVLKGHHTLIATPSGQLYFNTTGNAGLAKGGSGDVLTGIITALVAQGYQPLHAALMGVYLHGAAADIAARESSQEALIASDVIESIGAVYQQLAS